MVAIGEGADFSFSEIQDFDEHIAREIRDYTTLDKIVRGIAEYAIEDGTSVYDIGCSTGRFINSLAQHNEMEADLSRRKRVRFIGIEPNENMASQFEPEAESVELRKEFVTPETVFDNASFINSVFTLQFVPIAHRQEIIANIHNGLNDNGVFTWAEKVIASDPQIELMLTAQHVDFKRNGSSAEDILDKDRRLRSTMKPLALSQNLDMLRVAGFKRVETFWRVNNFVGVVAIKSPRVLFDRVSI